MTWIVRKISRVKWDPFPDQDPDNISADAITGDLRTRENGLSFWECESIDQSLGDVALVFASAFERLDLVDLAWVEKNCVTDLGIEFQKTLGATIVSDMQKFHVDAVNLNLKGISNLGRLFASQIRHEDNYKRFCRTEIKRLVADAVLEQRLHLEDLKDKLRKSISLHLNEKDSSDI